MFKSESDRLFYSRTQGGTVFNFFIDAKGNLRAEYVDDGEVKKAFLIEGFPWQGDLNDPIQRVKATEVLEKSYFSHLGGTVQVIPRLLGGWGDPQHYGLDNKLQEGEGTFTWARSAGFSGEDAAIIARANREVDGKLGGVLGETAPAPILTSANFSSVAQGWHFNVFARTPEYQITLNGSRSDSRVHHSASSLSEAIARFIQEDIAGSLQALGRGLHPLQDIFAHTSAFVTCAESGGEWRLSFKHLYSHIFFPTSPADDPTYINRLEDSPETTIDEDRYSIDGIWHVFNQRYSDTKTISLVYLYIEPVPIKISAINIGVFI